MDGPLIKDNDMLQASAAPFVMPPFHAHIPVDSVHIKPGPALVFMIRLTADTEKFAAGISCAYKLTAAAKTVSQHNSAAGTQQIKQQ